MGIGGSHEVKEEEKGFPSKHIFSPVGSPPPLDFFPPTSKERSGARDEVRWDIASEPVVFRWHHKGRERIPREVLLHGSWDDRTIRLVPDGEPSNANNPERASRRPPTAAEEETVFITIVNLPPGTYSYDFMVDGKVCLAPEQPIVNSRNSVVVAPSASYNKSSSSVNDEEGWGRDMPDLSEPNPGLASPQKPSSRSKKNQGPVELPAHLERALLNSQPIADDPSMLPLPHHVMLNHLYARPSLYNSYILGLTVRYRENFVTVVLYKPTEPAPAETS